MDSLFENNDAWIASGLSFTGPSSRSPLAVTNSRFIGNGRGNSPGPAVGGYRGALFIVDADASVDDNTFSGNRASNDQGAVGIYSSQLLSFSRNVIAGNSSGRTAGLYLFHVSPFTLSNNVVVDNRGTFRGRAVTIDRSSGQALHNTIANNSGEWGIELQDRATVSFANTAIVGHTRGITVTVDSSASLDSTLWNANSDGDTGGAGTITTVNDYHGDPAFAADGYHLTAGSAAIDRGVPAGVASDLDGDSRPFGARPDIGADEYISRSYVPTVSHDRR